MPDDRHPSGEGDGEGRTRPAGGATAEDPRRERLAAQLRANLQRRKEQARSRRSGEADQRPDGLGGGETK